MSQKTRFVMVAIAGGLLLCAALPAAAQDGSPLTRANMVFTGYGSSTYEATIVDEYPNNFTA